MFRVPSRLVRWSFPLALLAGCSPETSVIARVGSREIRRDDVLATAKVLAENGVLPADSARTALVNVLVQRELLVQAAQHEGLHRDTTFMDYRRRIEEQLLREHVVADLAGGPIAVSEAEIAEIHRWRAAETRARVIFTPMRDAAEAALAQIRAGMDFGLIANRFNPPGFAPPGGDIGFVAPGFLQPPLDDLIRTGVPGRLYGPVDAAPQGWFVVRIEERRPRPNAPLATDHDMLGEVVRQRKQRRSLVDAVDRLRAAYAVRVAPGAPQKLVMHVLPLVVGAPPSSLTEGERAATMVEYRGGVYTLGDAMTELVAGSVQRPNFQSTASVEHWLESRALDRVVLSEGRQRHYEEEPSTQRALRERLNDYLVEGYFTRHVLAVAAAADSDARALYRSDSGGPGRLRLARFLVVILRDSASAAQLATNAPHAEGLREAAATAAPGVPVRSQTVRFPTDHPLWSALEPMLAGLPPLGYAGPIGFPGGWLVVQLIDKAQGAVTFEELPPETRQALLQQATEMRRSLRLRAVTDSLRREFPVRVYAERLQRLVLPAPAGVPGS